MNINAKWGQRAKGNSIGTGLLIWVITNIGRLPAYFILFFASIQYTLLDNKSKTVLREFRNRAGLKCNWFHCFLHFYSFGMSLIDRYVFLLSREIFFSFSVHNEDLIENEVRKGRGVILLGAHFGNWELAGNLLRDRLTAKVNFLMFDAESEATKNSVRKATENRRVNIIYAGNGSCTDTSIALVNALSKGEIVCMHGDRVLGDQRFEFVPFLGENARFPVGPFVLSAVTGAPVIPIFTVKEGLFHYSFSALDPIRLDSIKRKERSQIIKDSIAGYVLLLEAMALKHPYQWFNFYHFWN